VKRVFKESLARLKTGKVKILYLVTPDSATPIESTLSAVQELHDEGLFEEFGVSNFSSNRNCSSASATMASVSTLTIRWPAVLSAGILLVALR
jgi:aryl-alcohol dehydrogenase-like predicted oxidoreductase